MELKYQRTWTALQITQLRPAIDSIVWRNVRKTQDFKRFVQMTLDRTILNVTCKGKGARCMVKTISKT